MNSRSLRLVVRPARGILGSSRVSHRTRRFLLPSESKTIAELRPNVFQIWRWQNLIVCVFNEAFFDYLVFLVRGFWSKAKIRVKNKVPLPAFRMDTHPKQDLDAQMVSFCDCLYFESLWYRRDCELPVDAAGGPSTYLSFL